MRIILQLGGFLRLNKHSTVPLSILQKQTTRSFGTVLSYNEI